MLLDINGRFHHADCFMVLKEAELLLQHSEIHLKSSRNNLKRSSVLRALPCCARLNSCGSIRFVLPRSQNEVVLCDNWVTACDSLYVAIYLDTHPHLAKRHQQRALSILGRCAISSEQFP